MFHRERRSRNRVIITIIIKHCLFEELHMENECCFGQVTDRLAFLHLVRLGLPISVCLHHRLEITVPVGWALNTDN